MVAVGALSSGTPNAAPEAMLTVSHDSMTTDGRSSFDIAGTPVRDLYPGAVRRIDISIENSQGRRIRVQTVEGRLVAASQHGCAPVSSNLELTPYRGRLPFVLSARSRARVGYIEVHMPNSVVNECQRVVFSIRFTGTAAWADR